MAMAHAMDWAIALKSFGGRGKGGVERRVYRIVAAPLLRRYPYIDGICQFFV